MALKLKVNERRNLQFEVQIGGIDYKELVGTLRVVVDDIEYGFPAEVRSESISVELPALNKVVKRSLKDDELLMAKLEIIGNGFYMDPWRSEFRVVNPVKIEAKVISEEESKVRKKKREVSVKLKEDETVISKSGEDKKIIIDDEDENEANKMVEQKLKRMHSAVDRFLTEGSPPVKRKSVKKKTIKKETYIRPEEITEKDVYNLMEEKGMKNSKAQEALLERAKTMCLKEDMTTEPDPSDVYEVIEKMLSPRDIING
jgi:hypothetical protein